MLPRFSLIAFGTSKILVLPKLGRFCGSIYHLKSYTYESFLSAVHNTQMIIYRSIMHDK